LQALAHKAYGQVKARTVDDRQLELLIFRQITEELQSALEQPHTNATARAEALNRNAQLWTILTTDLLHPDNAYEPSLKRSLIMLARFVEKATPKSMTDNDALSEIIEINTTVIGGLVAKPSPVN
jgi:flagellar protein FlaF